MNQKPKTATAAFYETRIILECPFCGMTLIKTDYQRIRKLLDETDLPRGKVCSKCGGIAILRLNTKTKQILHTKLEAQALSTNAKPTG